MKIELNCKIKKKKWTQKADNIETLDLARKKVQINNMMNKKGVQSQIKQEYCLAFSVKFEN